MAQGHRNHQYHLVDPSPWPVIGSASAFILAIGAIMWMHDKGPWVMFLGFLGVLYTMLSWWGDVIREAEHEGHHTPIVQLHHRFGMLLFIASEVMFFVAWFWAYFNAALFPREAIGSVWPPQGIEVFNPWHLPFVNTLILLLSGTTVTWAHHALLEGDRKGVIQGLWCTVLLGFSFSCVQAWEYLHAPFSISTDIYGSAFFMATGFHGVHVIIGTTFLTVNLIRAYRGHFSPKHHFGFEAAAWYWHFVDVVWLFLFVSIYWWGSLGAPLIAK